MLEKRFGSFILIGSVIFVSTYAIFDFFSERKEEAKEKVEKTTNENETEGG